jgi:hypothetical protein
LVIVFFDLAASCAFTMFRFAARTCFSLAVDHPLQ